MTSICILKLISGDEVVGQLMAENEVALYLNEPLLVETSMNPMDGTTSVILSSYIPFSKPTEALAFSKNHIVQCLPVKEEVERYYHNSLIYHHKHIERNIDKILESTNRIMEDVIEKKVGTIDQYIHKNISKYIQ